MTKPCRAQDAAAIMVVFLAAGLLDGFLAPIHPSTRRALCSVLVLALAWLGFALPDRRALEAGAAAAGGWARLSWALLLPVGLACLGLARPGAQLGGLALALTAIGHALPRTSRFLTVRAPAAVLGFALYSEFRLELIVRDGIAGLAQLGSRTVTTLTGHEVHLGATALGLDAAVLTMMVAATMLHGAPLRTQVSRLAAFAVAVGTAIVVYGASWVAWVVSWRTFTQSGFEEPPIVLRPLWILWGILVTLQVLAWCTILAEAPESSRRKEPQVRTVAFVAGLLLLVLSRWTPRSEGPARIALVTLEDDTRFAEYPTEPQGYYRNESFVLFARLLARLGHTIETAVEEQLELDRLDAVVYVSPVYPSEAAAPALREFIESGGLVWIVADHTPEQETLGRINSFLAGYSNALRFDSAFSHLMSFDVAGRSSSSPLGWARARLVEDNYGVGASLAVSAPARVLLDGPWCVGDRGVLDSAALIGNRHYEHGDLLTDTPLIAQASLGRGAVIVVGDTGIVLNSSIPTSHEQVAALLDGGLRGLPALPAWAQFLGLLLALCGLPAVAFAAPWSRTKSGVGPLAAAALVLGSTVLGEWFTRPRAHREKEAVPIVLVDASLRPTCSSFDRQPEKAVKGLLDLIGREGFLPLVSHDLQQDLTRAPAGVVLLSPSRPLSNSLRGELEALVREGGFLWIAAGYEERAMVQDLLRRFGISVLPVPLGSNRAQAAVRSGEKVLYQEGWLLDAGAAEALLTEQSRPLIARRRVGKGSVTVIADSYFFADAGLQTSNSVRPVNVAFVREMLRGADGTQH